MSAANELEAGRWIKKQIREHANLEAYMHVIPEQSGLPAVRWQVQWRDNVRVVAQHIIMTRLRVQVTVTIKGESAADLVAHVENIETALHRQNGETGKARSLACTYLEPYTYTENEGGDVYRHAGGVYEILVQSLS